MGLYIKQWANLIYDQLSRPYSTSELVPTMRLGSYSAPATYHDNNTIDLIKSWKKSQLASSLQYVPNLIFICF